MRSGLILLHLLSRWQEGLPCHMGIHQPVFSTRVCRWGSHEADCAKKAKGGSALTHVTTNLSRFITTGGLFTQHQPQEKQTQAAAVGTVMTIWCNSYVGKSGLVKCPWRWMVPKQRWWHPANRTYHLRNALFCLESQTSSGNSILNLKSVL